MTSPRARQLKELAERGEIEAFESLWLEAIDATPEDIDTFLTAVEALEALGERSRAGLYLSMLVPALLERELLVQATQALDRMVRVSPKEPGLRDNVLSAYRRRYADVPHLELLIEKSGLAGEDPLPEALDKLRTYLGFEVGAYLFHPAGWGTGRVAAIDARTASVVIDFADRPGHSMAMDMAARVTEALEPDDLRALKLDRPDELSRLIEEDHAEALRSALRSRRGKATQREIRDRFLDGILDAKAWSRWWTKAKRAAKVATDISIGPGSNPTLELTQDGGDYQQTSISDLRQLDTDKKRVRYLRNLLKEARTHDGGAEAVAAVLGVLAGPGEDGGDLEPGCRFSLACLATEAAELYDGVQTLGRLMPEALGTDVEGLLEALPSIPVSAHKLRALELLRQNSGERWNAVYRQVILRGDGDAADGCLSALVAHGDTAGAQQAVDEIVERYREHSQAFAWLLKTSLAERLPPALRVPDCGSLVEKALILHNHLEIAPPKARGAEDQRRVARQIATILTARSCTLVRRAFEGAGEAEARNLATILRNNRSLSRDFKNKLIATMFRVRPELARSDPVVAAGAGGGDAAVGDVLYVTRSALEAKRVEYENLVNVLIPENAAEIGRAASHGDLSENAEWTAAIERQGHLTQQSQEMASDLDRARIIDETLQDGETVGIGSRATLHSPEGETATYTILGPWDVNLDKHVISYQSPLGQSLLGKRIGDEATFESRTRTITWTVLEIADGLDATPSGSTV